MKNRNIFHIGFWHAASTLLQKEIFCNIPNYHFPNFSKRLINKSISHIPKNFGKYFYYEKPEVFREFSKYKKPFIYSSELLSGINEQHSYYKTSYRNENPYIGLLNLSKYAQDTNSHILFIIRNQTSIINSYYKRWSHLYEDENELFIDFPYEKKKHLSTRTLKFTNKYGMMYLNTFNYRLKLSILTNFINLKNIHIIPYEYLITNKPLFIEKLGDVFQKDLKFLIPRLEKKINSSKNISNKNLSKNFLKKIQNEFKLDNKILDEKFKLNLKKLGYY